MQNNATIEREVHRVGLRATPWEINALYETTVTTLVSRSKECETEIGDLMQPDFRPRVKTKFWDNECNFGLGVVSEKRGVLGFERETVIWEEEPGGVEARIRDLGGFGVDSGGVKLDVVFPKRPAADRYTFSVITKGLKFWRQPESREEYPFQGQGLVVPENVLGSYAIYHESKRDNQYRTGKAAHLYRPEMVDARGRRAWCRMELDIEAGLLHVEMPGDFLDVAAYPVTLDPDLGYTTIGGTNAASNAAAYITGNFFQMTENGTAATMYMYTQRDASDGNIWLAVYDDNTFGHPEGSNRVDYGAEITTIPVSAGWVSSAGLSAALTSGANYWVMHNKSVNAGVWYDIGGVDDSYVSAAYTYPPNNPHPAGSSASGLIFSQYLSYTTGGGSIDTEISSIGRGLFRGVMRGGR